MASGKTHKVTIRHAGFTYQAPEMDIPFHKHAVRGDEIEVTDEDYKAGSKIHAFVTAKDKADTSEERAAEVAALHDEIAAKDDDELEEWLEEDQPNVQTVIDAVGDDPQLANRVLRAENNVTENDPRATLVAGLEKVAD